MSVKQFRLQRFLYPSSNRGLIVPIDHGLTVGPITGIDSSKQVASLVSHPAINGVILHKGMAERLLTLGALSGKALMIHLNGMSTLSSKSDNKERLTSIERALRLGADGVSLQVNFTGENDSENLTAVGEIADEASRFNLPVLAMVYDKVQSDRKTSVSRLRHLIRISIELGCDAIKIAPPADTALLPEILADLSQDIAIFIAGGSLTDERIVLRLVEDAVAAGARGVCAGRNIFQREGGKALLDALETILRRNVAPFPVIESDTKIERERYVAH